MAPVSSIAVRNPDPVRRLRESRDHLGTMAKLLMLEGIVSRPRRPDHEFEIGPSTTAGMPQPISPELALVDPALRSEAQRRLGVSGAVPKTPGPPRQGRSVGSPALARAEAAVVDIGATRADGRAGAAAGDADLAEPHAARRRPR